MVKYKIGDEILCVNNHLIATLKEDISINDVLSADNMDFRQGRYVAGDVIGGCKICDGIWVNQLGHGFIDFVNVRENGSS